MIAISAVKKMAAEKSDIIFAPIRPLWRAFYSPEKSPAKPSILSLIHI